MSSSYDPSSTASDTDTNLPSIPTVNYPTPSATAVSDPKDHGVGAPFYLAIVLASISFIGCIAAFTAWWIRSRARKNDLELDDPWHHRNSLSTAGNTFTDNANEIEKGEQTHMETQTRPYYLPASIVRRSSSNLLAVPHTIPTLVEGTSRNGFSRNTLGGGRFPSLRRANELRSQNLGSELNPYRNVLSSEGTNPPTRPGMERLRTGLSVQESTRTLGRLRVANRVPGDITSGDEGGMNTRMLPAANYGGPNQDLVGENTAQKSRADQSHPSVQGGDAPLEPPGPATLSWGRRIDTVAALRRARRRTPETTDQAYTNPRYWYPSPVEGSSNTMRPVATSLKEDTKNLADPPLDPLGWKSSLKSSFWQAVDAMTGNRSSDPESRAANAESGSRFTPAPQRAVSRRSPVSPTRSTTHFALTDARTAGSQETEMKSQPILPDNPAVTQETSQNMVYSGLRGSSTRTNESGASHVGKHTLGQVDDSLPPRISRLNHDLGASTHGQHPNSLRTDTGSVYSTDSAAARANLHKYGYVASIPSTWSTLGATRESQLDLARTFFPLPRPISSPSPGPLSITPSQLTLESNLQSGSASVHTRTTMRSESNILGSDASTLQSGKSAHTVSYGDATTSSMYSMSRDGTVQSGHGTVGPGTAPLHSSSTTSSMLSRKKGVATRRKRPRPPARAPSTASSVQSVESGLSIREVAVRRALLERRKKVKAAESLKDRDREDSLTRSRDA